MVRGEDTIAQQAAAMRLHYQAGDDADDGLEMVLLDSTAHTALGARNRLLEDIGDALRERNSVTRISGSGDVLE